VGAIGTRRASNSGEAGSKGSELGTEHSGL
jgi:hypothetical protein